MTDKQFEAMLVLLMCSDPWPVKDGSSENQNVVEAWADEEAIKHGYSCWIDAYMSL